jgi:hypothetical protein
MPYTQIQISKLDISNFDFSNFDWRACKAHLKKRAGGYSDRAIHVAYSIARGRPIVGEHGIEQPQTREPMTASEVKWAINFFKLEEEKAA